MPINSIHPKVSIITPSYNQAQFIERTVLSVLCQDYPNIEYIVVDGNSNDGTKTILEKYSHHISQLIIEPDKGQSDALNKGFKLATGEFLAYINSDDCYAAADTISTVVKSFQDNPGVDVVYGRRYFINENGLFRYFTPYRDFNRELLYINDYIAQECTFWTRNIFEKSGFYIDEDFDFAMDYELWLRFLENDAHFLSIDHVLGLFRWYDSQKSQSQWELKGLPEIEKVHLKYYGSKVDEKVMMSCYNEHYFLTNSISESKLFSFYHSFWSSVVRHRRQLLKQPLDNWMFSENTIPR